LKDANGEAVVVTSEQAQVIYDSLVENGYVKKGELTDKYYSDKASGNIEIDEEVSAYRESIVGLLDSIYDPKKLMPDNVRENNITLKLNKEQFNRTEFKKLWKLISPKSYYIVRFEENELIANAIKSINSNLRVSKIYIKVTTGSMNKISSKGTLESGEAFKKDEQQSKTFNITASDNVKYDLVGKITENTGLTRKSVVEVLRSIGTAVFEQFEYNPEEFIIRASELINEQKATAIIQHITYDKLDECYNSKIFTEPEFKGKLGTNAMIAERHLFDHVIFDSNNEKKFAEDIDTRTDVAVYVKLPKAFYINTPVGKYNPDWAIAFEEGKVKHIYFIAETKGETHSLQFSEADLRETEKAKKKCAEEHFKAISSDNVKYGVVSSYEELYNIVTK
ncbi:MAG: restriction endonuclease subunit R, partial [Bacteroidales bacterium]